MTTLIFTGGRSPEPKALEKWLVDNISSVNFIIAADSGLETLENYSSVLSLNLIPNLILGDMDSIQDKKILEKYSAQTIKHFPQDKDFSDTELALMKAKEHSEQNTVILIGASGGRVDHFLSVYDLFTKPYRMDVWFTLEQKIQYLNPNNTYSILPLTPFDNISFSNPPNIFTQDKIETENLVWEGNCFSRKGMPSLSNRMNQEAFNSGKTVKVKVGKTPVLAIVSFDTEIHD